MKSFASQTLPPLEDHLKMAEQTQRSLGAARATSGRTGGRNATPKGTGGAAETGKSGSPQPQQK